jgi:hypothetical protein
MKPTLISIALAVVALVAVIAVPAWADPLPGEILKFYQVPLNNGAPAIPPGATLAGIPAPFPGHDEVSTVYSNESGFYQGQYMADDFCDYQSTPIVHVMWWGSYMNGFQGPGVQRFLIAFESDVPTNDPNNTLGYSHPGTNIVGQIVTLGPLAPGSGTFTEGPVPIGPGLPNPDGNLYQYNAELAIPVNEVSNQVMWIKIVALLDDRAIVWGWHNRDYGVFDPLACTAPGVVPGEFQIPLAGGGIYFHFQDDAVTGPITISLNPQGINVFQNAYFPTFYLPPYDGVNYSKDLAFALYTTVSTNSIVTNNIVINECGIGSTNGLPISGVLTNDPGPGGQPQALTYRLPFPGLVGDVIIQEGTQTNTSDLIRFNGNGTVIFYSDSSPSDPPDALADGPMPPVTYANFVTTPEIGPEGGTNYVLYTPAPGQPGYDASNPTYTFISDLPPAITVDEDGKGSIGCVSVSGNLANDPGPGGQSNVLTYPLPFPGVPGDVILMETPAGGPPSDILRFNGNGTVVFYSDPFTVNTNDCPDSLADGPGPTALYTTPVVLPEVGPEGGTNGATYTPTSIQPGWDPSGPTYTFISDYPPPADPFAAWQLKYFGCTNCAQAASGADPDGDGMSNTNEFLAGTVPTNSTSLFRVTSIVRQGSGSNDINITWTARPCKVYVVQVFPGNAPDGSYSNNFSDIASSLTIGGVLGGGFVKGDSTTNYVDVGGGTNKPSRYYRVRLVP